MLTSRAGGGEMHWIAEGEGPALVFIHGAGGNAAVWWEQVERFAGAYRTLTLDLPGFGRSSPEPMESFATHFADHVRAVMDAAGLERASVVCQSLGGWYGLRLALAYPERVEKLVLSCTMAGIAHPPAIEAFRRSVAKMDERGPASIALGSTFQSRSPVKAYLYQEINAFNAGLSPEAARQVFAGDVLIPVERLQSVRCPVLIISGSEDAIWPPDSLAGLVPAFPRARMEIVAACGHSPYFERPDEFAGLVRDFLAESED